jgi:Kef-type K+ transport system membrane component KefB
MFLGSIHGVEADESSSLLSGYVYKADEDTTRPIAFAQITIYHEETMIDKGVAGRNGSYSFTLNPGTYTITVEKRRYISQTVFLILQPNSILKFDFYLELEVSPYEALIIIEGLPKDVYPQIQLDGSFYGYAKNGTRFAFRSDTFHIIELSMVAEDTVRYIPTKDGFHLFTENETVVFQYHHQYYVSSNTNPWIDDWYDEGYTIHLETREAIDLGNATRLIFDGWQMNGATLKKNAISLEVDSSFRVDSQYRRQYLLILYSNFARARVKGGGWYDEGVMVEISLESIEVGIMPFKYRFKGWKGDFESSNAEAIVLIDAPKRVEAEWERVEAIKVEKLDPVYKAIIGISLLIFAAKILSGIFAKVKLPEILGELSAGMILGPYALGSLPVFGEPLIELNEYILVFAEVGAILLLFIAGLEVSFGRFRVIGAKSAIVGAFGVVVPFLLGLYTFIFLGFPWNVNLLVAATLTATSIAITMRTLEEMGKLNSLEGSITINAAVIDDVLGLVVLAVVMSIITSGVTPQLFDIAWILFRTIAFWLLLLVIMLTVAPRVVGVTERWKMRGTVEVVSIATCFGSAVAASAIGLSPIVGAFAAGMALASSRVLARVRDHIENLSILFSPIFFAVIGAEFNIRALSFEGIWLILILMVVAVGSKLVGCGLPAAFALRDFKKGARVGVGMISRGEVGLIIAGIGVTSGIMSQSLYGAVVAMVIFTTVITPIVLRWVYNTKPRRTLES